MFSPSSSRTPQSILKRIPSSTWSRWGDIIWYALIGLPCGALLAACYQAALEALVGKFTPPYSILSDARIVFTALLLIVVWRKLGTRKAHFRYLFRFPSLIVAVWFAGFLSWIGLISWKKYPLLPAPDSTWLWSVGVLVGMSFLAIGLLYLLENQPIVEREKPQTSDTPARDVRELLTMEINELLKWLDDESPVVNPNRDFLNAQDRAKRIWAALRQPRDGEELRKTVVLQGAFGAGKSTILNFLQQEAEKDRREKTIFAKVKCWGFSSTAAQEYILEQAVDELSEYVDCLGLRVMPAEYTAALEKTSSWLDALLQSFKSSSTPLTQMQKLTPVLRAIDARLVIFVEDTDRNGPDFHQKHIEAMLHNFRDVERVSFVLTAGKTSQIDFPKVAEQIIFLPDIPPEIVLSVLDRIRKHCREKWPSIDPTPHANRIENLTTHADSSFYWNSGVGKLIQTPRMLKTICATIVERWKILHGEVDLDELIMVTTIRYAAPDVFSFLGVNFSSLVNSKATEKDSELMAEWKEIVNKCGHNRKALRLVLDGLLKDKSVSMYL